MSDLPQVIINQSVAILIDGNNIERGLQKLAHDKQALLDFDRMVPKLLQGRGLKRLIYFREGISISDKLAQRLLTNFHGSVVPCHKSADIPLTIMATQIAQKVDTIIILSGDSDYVELVRHLKGEGVRVEIAAVQHATAKILVDEVEHFTPISLEDCYILKVPGRSSSSSRPTSTTKRTPAKKTSAAAKKTTEKSTSKVVSDKSADKPKRATKKSTAKPKTTDAENKSETKKSKPAPRKAPAKRASAKSATNNAKSSGEKPAVKKPASKRAPAKKRKPTERELAQGRPIAKSIKTLQQEARNPASMKKDDWDDLSF